MVQMMFSSAATLECHVTGYYNILTQSQPVPVLSMILEHHTRNHNYVFSCFEFD